jgi:hypothetical protein
MIIAVADVGTFLQHQLNHIGQSIIPNRVRQQSIAQLGGRTRAERADLKLVLQFRRMTMAILFGSEIAI